MKLYAFQINAQQYYSNIPVYLLRPCNPVDKCSICYLGVTYTIDTHLDWKHQCKSVVTKATRIFNDLRRTMFGCSTYTGAKFRAFCNCALVLPLLEYASPVWCPYSKPYWSKFSTVVPLGFVAVTVIH